MKDQSDPMPGPAKWTKEKRPNSSNGFGHIRQLLTRLPSSPVKQMHKPNHDGALHGMEKTIPSIENGSEELHVALVFVCGIDSAISYIELTQHLSHCAIVARTNLY